MYRINIPDLPDEFKRFTFPGGEPHLSMPIVGDEIYIDARIANWDDFATLLMVVSCLRRQGVDKITCYIPYFPGARMDRSPDGRAPLTVQMYADCLAAVMPYDEEKFNLFVFDIHSQAALEHITRSLYPMWQTCEVTNISVADVDLTMFDDDIVGVISPDTGAVDRACDMSYALFDEDRLVICEKERDFDTGHILSYSLPRSDMEGKWLVVDDICDGGRTFNMLAEAFYAQNPHAELQLYVSHGIFSKGVDAIDSSYSKIYTTDSFPITETNWRLKVVPAPVPKGF